MFKESLLQRLTLRNEIEGHYKELFQDVTSLTNNNEFGTNATVTNGKLVSIIDSYREELKAKDQEIDRLKEIAEVMNKNNERLNDEMISMTIENNVLEDKFNTLNEEHTKLVQRWLSKVQQDADVMNATIESQGSK